MKDYNWLFEDSKLSRGINVQRMSYADRAIPETSNYVNDSESPSFNIDVNPATVDMTPSEDSAEDIAESANSKLEDAVEHLEVNQNTLNALTTIVEQLNDAREDYHEEHPNPLDESDDKLTDPDWSKLSSVFTSDAANRMFGLQQKTIQAVLDGGVESSTVTAKQIIDRIKSSGNRSLSSIARVGNAPIEDVTISESEMRAKGLESGMTEVEMDSANAIIDSAFSALERGGNGFTKRF